MSRLIGVTCFVLALCIASPASAQLLVELSPEQVESAIKLGADDKAATRFLANYELKPPLKWAWATVVGVFTTPYSRVVRASRDAHRKYAPFSASDVPAELLKPEVVVIAPSQSFTDRRKQPAIANVTAVVVLPAKSKDRASAIQPIRTEDDIDRYQNLFGAKFEGRSMVAVFPADAFSEQNEIHVVLDKEAYGCSDCIVPIKLQNVK